MFLNEGWINYSYDPDVRLLLFSIMEMSKFMVVLPVSFSLSFSRLPIFFSLITARLILKQICDSWTSMKAKTMRVQIPPSNI